MLTIPEGYKTVLSVYDTQRCIEFVKLRFQNNLKAALNLKRVSAPLFVRADTGLNDDLNGVERPVAFTMKENETSIQVVHSLAKWKRKALRDYGFSAGEGLVADMNAIRRDEDLDNIHSIYVDQWDWERIIAYQDRNTEYLKETVQSIVDVICDASEELKKEFPQIGVELKREVSFITAQELEDLYPDNTPEEREHLYTKKHKTVFIQGIGAPLHSGKPHGNRAPDYDDWDLNGDILFWNDTLGISFEISSMGIRVDPEAMDRQLKAANCDHRRELPFHKMLLNNELPLTIGGGIGQSRLCMLLIGCAHIGEVQTSLWDDDTLRLCSDAGIPLL